MYTKDYFATDYTTKQSAGYTFTLLCVTRVIILILNTLLVLTGPMRKGEQLQLGLHLGMYVTDIVLLGVAFNFIITIIIFATWQAIEYRVSLHQLCVKKLMKRRCLQIELKDITKCDVHQNIAGRAFDYGTLTLHLLSKSKAIKLHGVPFPEQFDTHLKTRILVDRNLRYMQKVKDRL